jgi:hypothetical protein
MGEWESKGSLLVLIRIDQMMCDVAESIWRTPSGWLHCLLEADNAGRDEMRGPPNQASLSQKYLGCYEIGFMYCRSIWCNSSYLCVHPNSGLFEGQ